ncbi:nitrate reductase molybdenum cofactor assembly chaperone [Clostridium sp. YIM B02551]|uniref:nitrate reductase molybdenum cofactor assembly chaperone n=1 Tax=Clostridium sp. YIM B02551 TaxID=2910679 RepID=UPI001EEB1079|nr:nitrate reductase molybdenum cofactor assembly chaperone [Clostridium sp. YIM B02551]
MNDDFIKKVYLITSFLLRYPDNNWFIELKEIKNEIEEEGNKKEWSEVLSFINYVENIMELDLQELYVSTFDFTNMTPLNLSYFKYKEDRDRGMGLLNIKEKYRKAGFEMVENELPDFLPLILEFSALSLNNEILMEYKESIYEMFLKLRREGNPYNKVFNILLNVLKKDEIDCELTGGGNL